VVQNTCTKFGDNHSNRSADIGRDDLVATLTLTPTHTTLTAILQVNQAKPVAPSVALTGRCGYHKVQQPVPTNQYQLL